MDYSLPGSSVHGILQARILEWVAISYSRASSQLRDQTRVSCIAGRFFTIWATREKVSFKVSEIRRDRVSIINTGHYEERTGALIKGILGLPLWLRWLRIPLTIQGTRIRSLVQKDSTCGRATKPMRPRALCSGTREATAMRSLHTPMKSNLTHRY